MYAKALMPSDSAALPATPFLFVTTAPGSVATRQLISHGGWHPFRGDISIVEGEVRISPAELVVVVAEQVVLRDDTNPISPDGWWKAVDAMQGHIALVLIPAGTPFDQPAFGDALDALEGRDSTAQAIVRVVHSD